MAKLKPCPRCGYSNTLTLVHYKCAKLALWWQIKCWNCGLYGKKKLFLRRAKNSWNKEANNETD